LVAALVGGAYAATGLTGKQKKEVKKIAKQVAGKNGAPGPAGQPGAQGAKGDTGAAGTNGTNGTNGTDGTDGTDGEDGKNGESVTIIPLTSGDANCPDGGAKFTNQTATGYACNGKGGGDGEYPKALPPGYSMTGYWEVLGTSGINAIPGTSATTISFPLPLETKPTETVLVPASGGTEEQKDKCPGDPMNPTATPGVLCLYQNLGEPATLFVANPTTLGAALVFAETDEGLGTWAVEAPPKAP
jgi:hypothetical protein